MGDHPTEIIKTNIREVLICSGPLFIMISMKRFTIKYSKFLCIFAYTVSGCLVIIRFIYGVNNEVTPNGKFTLSTTGVMLVIGVTVFFLLGVGFNLLMVYKNISDANATIQRRKI